MPRQKTLLTPREQWLRTIEYASQQDYVARAQYTAQAQGGLAQSVEQLRAQWRAQWCAQGDTQQQTLRSLRLLIWCYRDTHKYLVPGDIFHWSHGNGMNERYGFTGVTSKGIPLNNFYLAVRYPSQVDCGAFAAVRTPVDFLDKRYDDPEVIAFIEDWRCNLKPYVGTPGSFYDAEPGSTPAQGLRFDGVYKSRRLSTQQIRRHDERHFLRFFPDGRVVLYPTAFESRYERELWQQYAGTYQLNGDQLSFAVNRLERELLVQYTGTVRDGKLYLKAVGCSPYWRLEPHEHVFTFRLVTPDKRA